MLRSCLVALLLAIIVVLCSSQDTTLTETPAATVSQAPSGTVAQEISDTPTATPATENTTTQIPVRTDAVAETTTVPPTTPQTTHQESLLPEASPTDAPTSTPMVTDSPLQRTTQPTQPTTSSPTQNQLGWCNGYPANDVRACSDHGQCVPNASNNASVCVCSQGYSGEKCSGWTCGGVWKNSTTVCSGHGVCFAPNACRCDPTYVGDTCQGTTTPTPALATSPAPSQPPPREYMTTQPPGATLSPAPQTTEQPRQTESMLPPQTTNPPTRQEDTNLPTTNAPRTTIQPSPTPNPLGWCNGFPANDSRACSGNGQCNPTSSNSASVCVCNQGYIGEKCSNWRCGGVLKNLTTVCSGHGACVAPDTCKCDASFVGDNCQGTPTPAAMQTTPPPSQTQSPPRTTSITYPPKYQCFGLSSGDYSVCSRGGACVALDQCVCSSASIVGKACEFNLQAISSTFKSAASSTSSGSILNLEAIDTIPGTTGTLASSIQTDSIVLSAVFADERSDRKAVCLRPPLNVGNKTTYVVSSAVSLSPGTALEFWFSDKITISVKSNTDSAPAFVLEAGNARVSNNVQLSLNIDYMILLSVDRWILTAQMVTLVSGLRHII